MRFADKGKAPNVGVMEGFDHPVGGEDFEVRNVNDAISRVAHIAERIVLQLSAHCLLGRQNPKD